MLLERPETDLCILDPGFEVDLFVDADLASFAKVWLGDLPMRQAIRSGAIKLAGSHRRFPLG